MKNIKKSISKISEVVKNSNYRVYATHTGVASMQSFSRMTGGTKFHFLFENKQGQELVFVDKETRNMFLVDTNTINKMGNFGTFPFSQQSF